MGLGPRKNASGLAHSAWAPAGAVGSLLACSSPGFGPQKKTFVGESLSFGLLLPDAGVAPNDGDGCAAHPPAAVRPDGAWLLAENAGGGTAASIAIRARSSCSLWKRKR